MVIIQWDYPQALPYFLYCRYSGMMTDIALYRQSVNLSISICTTIELEAVMICIRLHRVSVVLSDFIYYL